MGHLPATVTSVSLLSQVPLTALLAALLLHEPMTGAQILGGALVLAGVGWPAGGSIRRKKQMLRCARQASTNKLETNPWKNRLYSMALRDIVRCAPS